MTPQLTFRDSARAIDFYKQAFGAVELLRMVGPDGQVGHAEIKIGDSPIMLADECPAMGSKGPVILGGSPVSLTTVKMVRLRINRVTTAYSVRRIMNCVIGAPPLSRVHW